jgi:hypothetical protein
MVARQRLTHLLLRFALLECLDGVCVGYDLALQSPFRAYEHGNRAGETDGRRTTVNGIYGSEDSILAIRL